MIFKQTQIRERLDRTGVPLNCLVAFCTFLLCFQMFSAFRPCFVAPIWILRQVLTMLQSGGKNRGKSVRDQSSAPWNILQSTETCIYLKPIFKLFQRHVCVFIASLRISAYDRMRNYMQMHTMPINCFVSTLRPLRWLRHTETEAPTCATWCPKGNLDYQPVWWWGICWTWTNVGDLNVGRCCKQSHYSRLMMCTHSVHYW